MIYADPGTRLPVMETGKCLMKTGKIKMKDGFFFLQDDIFFIITCFQVSLSASGHDSTKVVVLVPAVMIRRKLSS